jgi:DNA polymerase (family 10)
MTSKTNLSNEQLAALFEELADLLELSGENAFRIRAYRSGAAAIQGLPQRVEELIAQGFDLTSVDGIGATPPPARASAAAEVSGGSAPEARAGRAAGDCRAGAAAVARSCGGAAVARGC